MKNKLLPTIAPLLVLSCNVLATTPTSITFDSEGMTSDNKKFATYIVKCSNGGRQPLTAWDKRKKWCVGSQSITNCHKQQIKAAKKACNT